MTGNDLFATAQQALVDLRQGDKRLLDEWATGKGIQVGDYQPEPDQLKESLHRAEELIQSWREGQVANAEQQADLYEKLLEAEMGVLAGAREHSLSEVVAELKAVRERQPKKV